jgi:hypothetical protein
MDELNHKSTFDWSNAEHVKKLIVGIFLSRRNIHVDTAQAFAVVATKVLAKGLPRCAVAAQLKITPGRVKQISRELRQAAEKFSPDAPLSQHPLRAKSVPVQMTPEPSNADVAYWRRVLKSHGFADFDKKMRGKGNYRFLGNLCGGAFYFGLNERWTVEGCNGSYTLDTLPQAIVEELTVSYLHPDADSPVLSKLKARMPSIHDAINSADAALKLKRGETPTLTERNASEFLEEYGRLTGPPIQKPKPVKPIHTEPILIDSVKSGQTFWLPFTSQNFEGLNETRA